MMVRVIEEVALDAPHLVVHLVPLGPRVDITSQLVQLQSSFAGLWRGSRGPDDPPRPLPVENLFAVEGNYERADPAGERLDLARGQIELRHCRCCRLAQRWNLRNLDKKQSSCLARFETHIIGRLDRQPHDALADPVKIDRHLYGFFLLFSRFSLFPFLATLTLFSLLRGAFA